MFKDAELIMNLIDTIIETFKDRNESSVYSEHEAYEICYADRRVEECINYVNLSYLESMSKVDIDYALAEKLLTVREYLKESKRNLAMLKTSLGLAKITNECKGTEIELLTGFKNIDYSTRIDREVGEDKLSVPIVETLGTDDIGLKSGIMRKLPLYYAFLAGMFAFFLFNPIKYFAGLTQKANSMKVLLETQKDGYTFNSAVAWLVSKLPAMTDKMQLVQSFIIFTSTFLAALLVMLLALKILVVLLFYCNGYAFTYFFGKFNNIRNIVEFFIFSGYPKTNILHNDKCLYAFKPKIEYGRQLLVSIAARQKMSFRKIETLRNTYDSLVNKVDVKTLCFIAELEIIAESYNLRGQHGIKEHDLESHLNMYKNLTLDN